MIPHILCLDAFRRAAELMPLLRLTYIGAGVLLLAARQLVKAFHLENKVTLLGVQPSEIVKGHMINSDIFIQHSMVDPDSGEEEGLPVAVLEAMAHGLPAVSTRHAGIPEAVLDKSTGLLVDEGDSEGMAQGIIEVCRDKSLRLRMGLAGWQQARDKFSWDGERAALLSVMGVQDA